VVSSAESGRVIDEFRKVKYGNIKKGRRMGCALGDSQKKQERRLGEVSLTLFLPWKLVGGGN